MDEQNENLKQILEFDPNDSSDSNNLEIQPIKSSPTPLDRIAKQTGISKETLKASFVSNTSMLVGGGDVYQDPDNVFTVDGNENGERAYYTFNTISNKFELGVKLNYYNKDFFVKGAVYRQEEGTGGMRDNTNAIFYRDSHVVFKAEKGKRGIEASYDKDGNLTGIVFKLSSYPGIEKDMEMDGAEALPTLEVQKKLLERVRHVGKIEGKDWIKNEEWFNTGDFKPEDFTIEYMNGKVTLKRSESGKETDVVSVFLQIDADSLADDFIPNLLLRDPQTHELNFDRNWKQKDALYEAGIDWQITNNDSWNTLMRK